MAEQEQNLKADSDLGFGTKIGPGAERLINQDGSFNVKRIGAGIGAINPYQYLIQVRWWVFALIVVLFYIALNSFFALLYLSAGIENLTGAPGESWFSQFGHAFFFSVQTFTTVGYGSISPFGSVTNLIASFEAMVGLLGFALATGVMYGRFSRPSAKIRYSEYAIVAPYQDEAGFMFRIVNRRQNQLIELEAMVVLMWFEKKEDKYKQRFERLELERNHVALFPLTWTLVHPITPESPLHSRSDTDLTESNAEFLISIKGFDETFSQVVHSRYSYKFDEVKWGYRFLPAFYTSVKGETILDIGMLDSIIEAEIPEEHMPV